MISDGAGSFTSGIVARVSSARVTDDLGFGASSCGAGALCGSSPPSMPPQVIQYVAIVRGILKPARRRRPFSSSAGEAGEPLINKRQRPHYARAGASISVADKEVSAVDWAAASPFGTLAPSLQVCSILRGRGE